MAIDASYQALPYEPLLRLAMHDREVAEALQFFDLMATNDLAQMPQHDDPLWLELVPIVRELVGRHSGILDRTLSTRAWDAVYWMLAPNRRVHGDRNPESLAEIAVFGAEPYPCRAVATQGIPFQLVRPTVAAAVADYVEGALEGASELFDVEAMKAASVYKAPDDRDYVLALLTDYARLYRQAAELDEWVLVVRD